MPTSACTSPGKAEGGPGRPPQEKKRGGKQTNSKRKGWGGTRQAHSHEATHPHHKGRAKPPARRHRRRHPRGPLKEHLRTALPKLATPNRIRRPSGGNDTLDTRTHTPLGQQRQKKRRRRSPNERGRGDGDQETEDRDRRRRTPKSHDTTGLKTTTPPRSPKEKKTKGDGGTTNSTHGNSRPHATGAPPRR